MAGKNQIAVDVGRWLLANRPAGLQVLAVPNRSDDGSPGWQPSFRAWAKDEGLPIVEDPLTHAEDADLVVLSVESDRLFMVDRFRSPHLFNIHFSLLPRHRGVYTAVFPLLEGDGRAGVTLHRMDAGIDTGAILDQESFDVEVEWTGYDLYLALMALGTRVVLRNLPWLLAGAGPGQPQPLEGATYHARKDIDLTALEVPLKGTAWEIHNRVRALIFPPYQLPTVGGHAVCHSRLVPGKMGKGKAGTWRRDGSRVRVTALDGEVELTLAS